MERYHMRYLRMSIVLAVCAVGASGTVTREETAYKASKLNKYAVAVGCRDYSLPKIDRIGGFVVVSCEGN
jgi:hypothetical protein